MHAGPKLRLAAPDSLHVWCEEWLESAWGLAAMERRRPRRTRDVHIPDMHDAVVFDKAIKQDFDIASRALWSAFVSQRLAF